MKKIILSALLILTFSCNTTSYIFEDNVQNYGLDLSKGKWILNEIDCPSSVYGALLPLVNEKFKEVLQDSLFDLGSAKGIILPKKIDLQPNKFVLEKLKLGTKGYNYLINIRAKRIGNELGNLDIDSPTANYTNQNQSNRSEVVVEVYDLKLCEIIYSKKVMGSNSKTYDSNNQYSNGRNSYLVKRSFNSVSFQKNTDEILLGCFKRIMKDIKSKSVKQKITTN